MLGLPILRLFLQMLQLNLESQMMYAGSWIPTATDVYQPALPEKNPAWEERNCSGPKPPNALSNSKKPQCRGRRVDHSLYSALPGGSIPTRVSTLWLQSTSMQGGKVVKAAHRLAIRRQGLWEGIVGGHLSQLARHALSVNLFVFPSGNQGLSRCHTGKESSCQCRRHRRLRFNPWVR